MLVMFGGLSGSFWWVMLCYTLFHFVVIEIASPKARTRVPLHPTTNQLMLLLTSLCFIVVIVSALVIVFFPLLSVAAHLVPHHMLGSAGHAHNHWYVQEEESYALSFPDCVVH
jgi:hypothetical protein